MLANLKGLFSQQAVAQSLRTLPPLESTIMDSFFKQRPTHPLSMLGITDLKAVVQTVPVVRRDGVPVPLDNESIETQFFAPLPIKVQIPVTAAELNDLRVLLGNQASIEAWRTQKVDQVRQAVHATTEGMCAGVLTTGKLAWPVQLPGGRTESYGIDYGTPLTHTPSTKLTGTSKLSDVYRLLRAMQQEIRMAGIGGRVEFMCGEDVTTVFLDMAENYRSTAQDAPIGIKLGDGEVRIGSYVIRFMDETYPPVYLTANEDDGTVPFSNSLLMEAACKKSGIPCQCKFGKTGGHSYGLGVGLSVEGWLKDALAFWKSLPSD